MKIAFLDFGERWSRSIKIGLSRAGHQVIEIQAYRLPSTKLLLSILNEIKPDFCLIRNFYVLNAEMQTESEYRELFEQKQFRFLVWYHDSVEFNDPPALMRLWRENLRPQNFIFASVDKGDAAFFSSRGLPFIYLPIAAGEHFFHADTNPGVAAAESLFEESFSFVGSQFIPMSQSNLHGDSSINLSHLCLESFINQLGLNLTSPAISELRILFENIPKTPAELRKRIAGLESLELVDVKNIHLGLLSSYLSWIRLSEILKRLTSLNLVIHGAETWKKIIPQLQNKPRSLSEEELVACYRKSLINFNSTKLHFLNASHERPFNILASGGLPLTDHFECLTELFDESELMTYSNLEEIPQKIEFLKKTPAEKNRLIQRGRERVLKEHTYTHRAKSLVQFAQREWGLH